ncbi:MULTISPECIES: hypothetical protein [Terrabacteria group]|uniref:hypothetical protein n=1 Tax=Bacillati TaxID=1783272 RepID=UPI001C6E7E85|nr:MULTISPECIES: hypothetical protein [Terrabacteria group]MBW9212838.1 hypothetical protein [Trueperella sp. zg.1013]
MQNNNKSRKKRKGEKKRAHSLVNKITKVLIGVFMMISTFLHTNYAKVNAETVTTTAPPKTLVVKYFYSALGSLEVRADCTSHSIFHFAPPYPSDTITDREYNMDMNITSVDATGNVSAVSATLDGAPISISQANALIAANGFMQPSSLANITLTSTNSYTAYPSSGDGSRVIANVPLDFDLQLNDGTTVSATRTVGFNVSHSHYPVSSFQPTVEKTISHSDVEAHPLHNLAKEFTKTFTIPASTVATPYPPIVTAHPDIEKTMEDNSAVDWNEGITATWGKTTSKTIPSDGTITDDSLVSGNDTKLSSTGANFDVVGYADHNYTIKDSTGDNTQTGTSRRITVKTSTAPNIEAYYAGTNDVYGGEWLSQHADADADRRKGVDIKGTTTAPGTTYDTTIFKNGTEVGGSSGNAHTVANYTADSTTNTGDEFEAQLLGTGDHTVRLSPKSAKKVVKIDSVIPTANATTSNNWATVEDASTDALSGVKTTYVRFVNAGFPAPTFDASDSNWLAIPAGGTVDTGVNPGIYDVYFYAIDHATNKSGVTAGPTHQVVTSSASALISAKTNDGEAYVSGTWTNKDVTVTVKEPTGWTTSIPWFGAAYEGSTQVAKATTPDSSVDHTYTSETAGTTVNGYIVDGTDTKLSAASDDMNVRIDKTKPNANVTYNKGAPNHGFTDTSTDGASGIKPNTTKVAIVKSGDPAPSESEYKPVDTTELPNEGHYDVYVITEDNAGNKSVPNKALENISRSGKDQIIANDFSRGLNEGALTAEDAKALAVASGKYYGAGNIPFADLIVDPADLANINAKITAGEKGTYELKISTPAVNPHASFVTTAEKTIKVTLMDQGHGNSNDPSDPTDNTDRIYGNDFLYGMNNGHITDDAAKILASVNGYRANNVVLNAGDITVDAAQLVAINTAIDNKDKSTSPMPLTFVSPDGTSVTVNVTLFDNGSETPTAPNTPSIGANNFNYGIDEPDLTEAIAKQLSKVTAKDGSGNHVSSSTVTVNPTELAAIVDGQHNKKNGEYPLTFEYGGVKAKVTVKLVDHGNLSPTSTHITANDFSYGFNETPITDVIAKVRSTVSAMDGNNQPIPASSITVDPTELNVIQKAQTDKQKGTYPLTFTTPDGTSLKVKVTMYDNAESGTGGPTVSAAYIGANDFAYGADEPDLTDKIARILSKVNAHDANGIPIPTANIDVNAKQLATIVDKQHSNTPGVYPLTFTANGMTTTVKVQIKSHGAGDSATQQRITGNDFIYGINEGSLTDTESKIRSMISATDVDGTPIDSSLIKVNPKQLADINDKITNKKPGDYPLTFTTPSGTKVTVTVNLRDMGVQPNVPNGIGNIGGNSFTHDNGNGELTADKAKELAKIIGKDVNGNPIPLDSIKVNSSELTAINDKIKQNEGGTYPLTFTTPDGATITVVVQLKQKPISAAAPKQKQKPISATGVPRTSDDNALMLYGVMGLASVVLLFFLRRKEVCSK